MTDLIEFFIHCNKKDTIKREIYSGTFLSIFIHIFCDVYSEAFRLVVPFMVLSPQYFIFMFFFSNCFRCISAKLKGKLKAFANDFEEDLKQGK